MKIKLLRLLLIRIMENRRNGNMHIIHCCREYKCYKSTGFEKQI